jgi:2,3-bisphosphoglycerate-independent phosphoglycerate mutase
MSMCRRVVLVVLDGFGERPETEEMPCASRACRRSTKIYGSYPHVLIGASGNDVGLPDGQMGTARSATSTSAPDASCIRTSFASTRRSRTVVLRQRDAGATIDAAKASGGTLHLFGLTSPGNVHASLDHAYAVCEMAKQRGLTRVAWHAFLDGRDTPPSRRPATCATSSKRRRSASGGWRRPSAATTRWIATSAGSGRGGLADADARRGPASTTWPTPSRRLRQELTDEFVTPLVSKGTDGAVIKDGDACFFFNFRSDRARQLTLAFHAATRLHVLRSRAAAEARRVRDHDPVTTRSWTCRRRFRPRASR